MKLKTIILLTALVFSTAALAQKNKVVGPLADDNGVVDNTGDSISKGYDAFPDPQLLWNTLQQVAGMQDQLWICTLHDGLAYAAERDTVQLDIKQKGSKVTVTPSMALDKSLFRHPLTLVIDSDVAEALQERKRLAVKHKGDKSLIDINPYGGKISITLKQ